jgi:phosphoglycerate dehydrogenase-like enzyme
MRCAIGPDPVDLIADAVRAGGGTVVGLDEQPEALVWLSPLDKDGLRAALATAPTVRWVQLPFAGVEAFVDVMTPDRTWTCAKGAYAEPTAEHAMALLLAGLRRLPEHARATGWGRQGAQTLYDAPVVVLGAGGITACLLDLLAPYRAEVTVVRRSADPFPGAARTVTLDALDEVLPGARGVVLALALTPETEHVIGARQLSLMDDDAWLVNVARGRHVDTAALVQALQDKAIGGAALDVTDPEPLPADSPLWQLPNCLVTPHTANPWQSAQPLLSRRITENITRYDAGEPLLGLVDLEAGY